MPYLGNSYLEVQVRNRVAGAVRERELGPDRDRFCREAAGKQIYADGSFVDTDFNLFWV